MTERKNLTRFYSREFFAVLVARERADKRNIKPKAHALGLCYDFSGYAKNVSSKRYDTN